MTSTGAKLAAGGSLPDLTLPSASGQSTVPLKPGGRRNPVVIAIHGGGCEECRAYVGRLAAADAELREGDAHVVVIAPDAVGIADGDLPFPAVTDLERRFARRTGIEGAGVVIADQWGEVAHVADAGAGHDLPDPREIARWVQYLAIRCPECEGEAL
ncbi:MAG TPA: redoxin domain-containing protein [Longimicrobiaceae bacterium]